MDEMVKFEEVSQEQLQNVINDVMTGQKTIQEVKGLSDEQMEAIYSMGYNLYQNAKYEDATQVFTWLTMLNPFQSKYWMGLGGALQMSKDFDWALQTYAMAAVVGEPRYPTPHLHAGECYMSKGDLDEAVKGFKMAMDFSEGNDKYKKVHLKAKAFCEILKQQLSKNKAGE